MQDFFEKFRNNSKTPSKFISATCYLSSNHTSYYDRTELQLLWIQPLQREWIRAEPIEAVFRAG